MIQTSAAIASCRERFPSLVRPDSPVFFDNPGGTQVPREVVDAVAHCLLYSNSNVHGAFPTSERADQVVAEAHAAMADLLGAARPEEVAFGPNMTTLTFSLSRALGSELREGDEILLTTLDHDANVAPWLLLAEDRGLRVRFAGIDPEDCTLDVESFEAGLNERTRVAAFTYASNAVGTINDVKLLSGLAHDAGALVVIDAVHYAPHGSIDVRDTGCDFLLCSPYKFFGPHAGVLYSRYDHSERLRAYKVRPADDRPPHKWETGTQSHEAMAGTTAAVDYIASLAPEGRYGSRRERLVAAQRAVREYERELSRRMLEGLRELPVTLYGIADLDRLEWRVPTFALGAERLTPRQLAEEMGRRGFNLWDGNYYALALMERLGLEESGGALRIGMAHYNTVEEVQRFLSEFAGVLKQGTAVTVPAGEESTEHTSQG